MGFSSSLGIAGRRRGSGATVVTMCGVRVSFIDFTVILAAIGCDFLAFLLIECIYLVIDCILVFSFVFIFRLFIYLLQLQVVRF